jgi:cell division protein FtsA
MHGFRLEVEAHIVMAATSSLQNLQKCVEGAGVYVDRFILNPLASGDVTLSDSEREMGVMVVDIGGGTTDIAIFIDGTVWHTAVISVAGWHVTNDIAQLLHLPYDLAEGVKKEYGHCDPREINPSEMFIVQPFGEEQMSQVQRADLAHIIHARVEELFQLVLKEVKYSAYDGLLSAGAVLTGGGANLPGIKNIASDVLKMPVRIAQPERLSGMADQLRSPSYSTSVGLLRLGLMMDQDDDRRGKTGGVPVPKRPRGGQRTENGNGGPTIGSAVGKSTKRFLGTLWKRLLPEDDDNS